MIGIDAAELSFIRASLDRLPNFRRTLERGALHRLESTAARLTGSVWPTFFTGTGPGVHGIYHHLQWDADAMRLRRVAADWLDCEPFWYGLERQGLRPVVVDVPMAFPSRLRRGVEITNWGSHDTLGPPAVHPDELGREVRRRFGRQHPMGFEIPVNKTHGELERIRRNLVAGARRKGQLSRWLLETQEWDFFLTVFGETHRGGHILWPVEPSADDEGAAPAVVPPAALLDVYQAVDGALGEVLDGLARYDGTTVIVFALHGMGPNTSQEHFVPPIMDRLNARFGTAARGAGTAAAAAAPPVTGQRSLMRRLRETLPARLQNAIASAVPVAVRDEVVNRAVTSGHDWRRTPGFALLADLNGYIRFNLRGRERDGSVDAAGGALDGYLAWLREGLESFRLAGSGQQPLVEELVLARDAFPGQRSDRLPDVIVSWTEAPPARRVESELLGPVTATLATGRGGNHRPDGFAIVLNGGPEHGGGASPPPRHILDLAPLVQRTLAAA